MGLDKPLLPIANHNYKSKNEKMNKNTEDYSDILSKDGTVSIVPQHTYELPLVSIDVFPLSQAVNKKEPPQQQQRPSIEHDRNEKHRSREDTSYTVETCSGSSKTETEETESGYRVRIIIIRIIYYIMMLFCILYYR